MPFTKKRKKILYYPDVVKMLRRAREVFDDEKSREVCSLIAFLYKTGTRISEALNITREDFKIFNEQLLITVRPLKQRKNVFASVLPFRIKENDKLLEIIIKHVAKLGAKEKVWDFTRKTAWEYITTLNPDIYPHIFRHSRATHLSNKGASEGQLRRWFRWANKSDMPTRYVNLSSIQMLPISELTEGNE